MLLTEAWRRGVVLAGLSAGAMCWFEGGITKSSGPPEPIAGLGLLPGSLTVHADGEPERLPAWLDAVRSGALPGGWAADDGAGLLFRDRRLARVVASRPGAGVLRCDAVAGELVRERIEAELLGSEPSLPPAPHADVLELRSVQRLRHR
jgi:peptidase E